MLPLWSLLWMQATHPLKMPVSILGWQRGLDADKRPVLLGEKPRCVPCAAIFHFLLMKGHEFIHHKRTADRKCPANVFVSIRNSAWRSLEKLETRGKRRNSRRAVQRGKGCVDKCHQMPMFKTHLYPRVLGLLM